MTWWSADDDEDDEDEFDESQVRVRPNRRGSRPRTKTRPEHADAVAGTVLGVDRGRYSVLVDEGGPDEHEVTAARASELRRKSVVTGDHVDLVGDVSGEPGSLSRIVRVGERTTLLRRSADDTDEVERIIVANADQMLIVVSAANPEPRIRLVDRYLVAAFDARIQPLLVVTKTDLADPTEFLDNFAGLEFPVFRSSAESMPLDEIADALVGAALIDEHGISPAIDAEYGARDRVGVVGTGLGAGPAATPVGAHADLGFVELVLVVLVVVGAPPGHASSCSQSAVNCGRVLPVEAMSSTITPGTASPTIAPVVAMR